MENIADVILENEGLIYGIITKYKRYFDLDDLYQVAVVGMIKAYKKYNKSFDTKFTSYAYPYILGEVIKYINGFRSIKISKTNKTLYLRILKAKEKLAQKLMRKPTQIELCDFLEITELELAEALNSNIRTQSIENNIGDTSLLLEEILADPYTDYDDILYLKMAIEALEEPERTIMIKRFYEDKTQSEIAKLLGTNQVDVSRHASKALTKIKAHWHFYSFYL